MQYYENGGSSPIFWFIILLQLTLERSALAIKDYRPQLGLDSGVLVQLETRDGLAVTDLSSRLLSIHFHRCSVATIAQDRPDTRTRTLAKHAGNVLWFVDKLLMDI